MKFALLAVLTLCACGPQMMPVDAGSVDPCVGVVKSPPNLASNPGFECGEGSPTDWSAQYGTLSVETANPKAGQRSVKVVATATGAGQFAHTAEVVKSTSGKTYCINAWVRGTTSDARLEVRSTPSQMTTSFGSPVASPDTWLRMPPSTNLEVRVPAGESLYVVLRTHNGKANDTLFADEVDLWESADGNCKER